MDTGDGVHWPGSNMLNIFSNYGPKRSFPGSGGIKKFPEVSDTMDTGPRNVSLEAGVETTWPEFRDMAPGNIAGLWLLTLIRLFPNHDSSRTRQRGMWPFRTTPGFAVFTRLHFWAPFFLGRYGWSALVYTRRHNFMCHAITRPVCLFAGAFGARNVV